MSSIGIAGVSYSAWRDAEHLETLQRTFDVIRLTDPSTRFNSIVLPVLADRVVTSRSLIRGLHLKRVIALRTAKRRRWFQMLQLTMRCTAPFCGPNCCHQTVVRPLPFRPAEGLSQAEQRRATARRRLATERRRSASFMISELPAPHVLWEAKRMLEFFLPQICIYRVFPIKAAL